jgi:putative endonuclease
MYYVYILRTSANTLYIGQTNNLEKRIKEHKNKTAKSAKYIRYFSSFVLVYSEEYQTRREAMQREYQLKQWSRAKKEALIKRKIHIAIMRKSWGLTQKILSGEKTVESRWYLNRYRPWGQIAQGETIYFKDSGGPVRIRAIVAKVLQFEGLTPHKVKEILNKYAQTDGLGVKKGEINFYFKLFKNKKYCLLVFLKDPKEIKPFEINKSGFGAMVAWITVDNLNKVKKLRRL